MNYPDNVDGIRKKWEPILEDLNYFDLHVLNTMIVNRMRMIRQTGTVMTMSKFNIGDMVSWYGNDEVRRTGKIIKMNSKSVSVLINNQGYWNVSPELLNKE